jgi:hypothetical protein
MKRIALQVLLGMSSLLMFFRFGWPALIFGATGPGPFGYSWLEGGKATLLLDADLRFCGAMMIGLGFVFLFLILRPAAHGPLIYLLACAIAIGAAARIYARIMFGDPGTAGTVPVVIEGVLPVFLVVLSYLLGRDSTQVAK